MPCLMRSPVQPTSDSARARIALADLPRLDKTAARSGHALLKRGAGRSANYQSLGDRSGAQLLRVVGVQIQCSPLRGRSRGAIKARVIPSTRSFDLG
jgi:hypothetical protein